MPEKSENFVEGKAAKTKGKKKPKRHPGGRPPKYDARFHPVLVGALARLDKTMPEIAAELGIRRETIWAWAKQYPEFSNALNEGRDFTDARVEDSLNRRANGYEYEETEIVRDTDGETKVKKTKKVMPPDPTSCIFWLKNRRPKNWRDKHDHEVTGRDGGAVQVQHELKDAKRCSDEFESFAHRRMGADVLPKNGNGQPVPESTH